MGILLTFSR